MVNIGQNETGSGRTPRQVPMERFPITIPGVISNGVPMERFPGIPQEKKAETHRVVLMESLPRDNRPFRYDPQQLANNFLTAHPVFDLKNSSNPEVKKYYYQHRSALREYAETTKMEHKGALDISDLIRWMKGSTQYEQILSFVAEGVLREPAIGLTPDIERRVLREMYEDVLEHNQGVKLTPEQEANLRFVKEFQQSLVQRVEPPPIK